jgi:hypothetical protein
MPIDSKMTSLLYQSISSKGLQIETSKSHLHVQLQKIEVQNLFTTPATNSTRASIFDVDPTRPIPSVAVAGTFSLLLNPPATEAKVREHLEEATTAPVHQKRPIAREIMAGRKLSHGGDDWSMVGIIPHTHIRTSTPTSPQSSRLCRAVPASPAPRWVPTARTPSRVSLPSCSPRAGAGSGSLRPWPSPHSSVAAKARRRRGRSHGRGAAGARLAPPQQRLSHVPTTCSVLLLLSTCFASRAALPAVEGVALLLAVAAPRRDPPERRRTMVARVRVPLRPAAPWPSSRLRCSRASRAQVLPRRRAVHDGGPAPPRLVGKQELDGGVERDEQRGDGVHAGGPTAVLRPPRAEVEEQPLRRHLRRRRRPCCCGVRRG